MGGENRGKPVAHSVESGLAMSLKSLCVYSLEKEHQNVERTKYMPIWVNRLPVY